MEKEAFLIGSKIYLRPLKESDAEGDYPYWFNDSEVCKYNHYARFPNTYEKTLDYIKSIKNSREILVFAIIENGTNTHVGNVSLSKIDFIDRNAELSIIIGEKNSWGKGYGKEACKLLIEYGFNVLNLHRIYAGTSEDNLGFRKLAEAIGMKEEGKYLECIFKNGKYLTAISYSILNPNHK